MNIKFEIDALSTAGIIRMGNEESNANTFDFNCLVPDHVKEEEVADYVCRILDCLKDKMKERKSFRFKDKLHKRKGNPKDKKHSGRKYYDKPSGTKVGPVLKAALDKRGNGKG